MSKRERNDAIFQAALTPAVGYRVPAGLAEDIHDALLATPQATARPAWSIDGRNLAPVARSAWILVVIAALLALVVTVVVLSSRPNPVPLGIPRDVKLGKEVP